MTEPVTEPTTKPNRTDERRTGHGTVLAFDRAAGTMVVDVRYRAAGGYLPRSPYPPLAIPIPAAAPAWLFRVGLNFQYTTPGGYQLAAAYEDPHLMRDFEPVDYWWATVAELEAALGCVWPGDEVLDAATRVARLEAARDAIEARRQPVENYWPTADAVAAALARLRPYFPEWVEPDGTPVARPA